MGHHVSRSLHMELIFRTKNKLVKQLKENIHLEAIIHFNQGFHCAHPAYQTRIYEMRILQSMFRRGNCLDYGLMESYFGYLKDYIDYQLAPDINEVCGIVDTCIDYYNSELRQWKIQKMTPVQYRSHHIVA